MAYRLDPSLPVGPEIRRVISEQLGLALDRLAVPGGPDAVAVRDIRKNLKKARAAIQLARADVGVPVARQAVADLRAVGTVLASQRDADALTEAAERLAAVAASQGDHIIAGDMERLAGRLDEEAAAARADGGIDRRIVAGAASSLRRTSTWLALVRSNEDGWDALAPGFERTYHRARRGLADLGAHPDAEALHDLRKLVKALWYQERLLRGAWPEGQKPLAAAADRLGQLLGDDHDLTLLVPRLDEADDAAAAHAMADRERQRLLGEARLVGRRLLADSPDAWIVRHRAWWAAADAPRASPPGVRSETR